ncbi:MAG: hypothetical protein ACRD9R_13715 [Pyrinomonadaceae bacterium]
MSSVKFKKNQRREPRRETPADVRQLLDLLLGEMQSPRDLQKLLGDLPPVANCVPEAIRFLKAKDRAQRREAFIKNEALWFGKYGWFMARIVGFFGLLVFVFAVATRGGVDFFTFALLGAAGYYLLLMTLSNWRYRNKNKKRRRQLGREAYQYQTEIVSVAAELMRRWELDPSRYPVEKPYNRVGLELREDGSFYIPLS